ncbi:DUF4334 domain-containing protein [Aquicoccus sp. SCR17]|nr:DUF4334 domain-containing protein [Carideicomes alvinocaridis]
MPVERDQVSSGAGGRPNWVRRWQRQGISTDAALARFDSLPGITSHDLLGAWRGRGMPTGHLLDGLLERLGWRGKRFESPERVDPLVFHADMALDPRLMPLCLALRWPRLARSAPVVASFTALRRVFRARGPAASLAHVEFRGCLSAAMIYDRQPIIDHFRRIDTDRVLGLMRTRAMSPYFFLLTREDECFPGSVPSGWAESGRR